MSYLIIDTETTGIPTQDAADAPGQPRVASVAMIFCDNDLDMEYEWSSLIKPDGWVMPDEAQRINGLSMDRLNAEGTTILYPLSMYAKAIDQGRMIVAHNIWFDTKMMRGELRRAGMADRFEQTNTLCTMKIGRHWCSRGKLAVVYEELTGQYLQGAHDALHDARACLACLRTMAMRGYVAMPFGWRLRAA